jgi:hypothetical protein
MAGAESFTDLLIWKRSRAWSPVAVADVVAAKEG